MWVSFCSRWTREGGKPAATTRNQDFMQRRVLKRELRNFPTRESRGYSPHVVCSILAVYTGYCMCGCVLASPPPPPRLLFPPGRQAGRQPWDGDWQHKKKKKKKREGGREPIEELLVLPLTSKGAGISRKMRLRWSTVSRLQSRQPQR